MSPAQYHTPDIPFTIPFLPPRERYELLLAGIWERNWLTNNGQLLQQLEAELSKILDIPTLITANGTLALQLSIRALELKGHIITTPFSYIATTSGILWEQCSPVFADIDPFTLNIDPASVAARITPQTTAILATHVFGNACDVDALERMARENGLKLIYDAAHAFGSSYHGRPLAQYGDISATSFHATKLYHMTEGGGLSTRDTELLHRISWMRNFGHDGPGRFAGLGINAKNSELHAAMGLANLPYIPDIIACRRQNWLLYRQLLQHSGLQLLQLADEAGYNGAYFPLICRSETQLLALEAFLDQKGIGSRRYFYPALNELHFTPQRKGEETPLAASVSRRVLCLPMYYGLQEAQVRAVCSQIHEFINHQPDARFP